MLEWLLWMIVVMVKPSTNWLREGNGHGNNNYSHNRALSLELKHRLFCWKHWCFFSWEGSLSCLQTNIIAELYPVIKPFLWNNCFLAWLLHIWNNSLIYDPNKMKLLISYFLSQTQFHLTSNFLFLYVLGYGLTSASSVLRQIKWLE